MPTVADMFRVNQPAQPPPPGFAPEDDAPPPGFVLEGPKPKTPLVTGQGVLRGMGITTRDMLQGGAGLIDDIANIPGAVGNIAYSPIGAITQALGGTPEADIPMRHNMEDAASGIADRIGLPKAETPVERVLSSGVRGGLDMAALATGAGEAKALTMPGKIAHTVAELFATQPVKQVVAGASAAASGQTAAENGAGPVGQTAAALAGGFLGFAGAGAVERRAMGRPAAHAIAETTPKELMVDANGELTPDGLEASIRHNIPAEQIKRAYAEVEPAEMRPSPKAEPVAEPATVAPEAAAVEAAPVEPVAARPAPEAPVTAPESLPAAAVPEAVPAQPKSATARLMEAQSLEPPVPLTPGQAAQDAVIQRAENDLKNTSQVAGYKAEDFRQQQQTAIAANLDKIRTAFGDPNLTTQARGEAVQSAVRDLEQRGAAGVTAKYKAAKEIAGPDAHVNPAGILEAADDVIINKPVEPGTRQALETLLAKFEMLDGEATPAGRYTVVTPKEGAPVKIIGEVTPLTLDNAEQFRQGLNAIYRAEQHGFTGAVTRALDRAVDEAIEAGSSGEKASAFKEARAARREQAKTFEAKDIVSRLAGVKNGTDTDLVSAERGIREVLGSGKDDVTNLKRIKALLLSKPTEGSKAAWRAIQSQGIEDIMANAKDPHGGFSGAKLTSAINRFGREKLRVLLEPADFNGLMKAERVVRNATVPLPNTVNSSGSGYAVARMAVGAINKLGLLRHLPVAGPLVDGLVHYIKRGVMEAGADRAVTKTINFTLKDAAKIDAKAVQRKSLRTALSDMSKKDTP